MGFGWEGEKVRLVPLDRERHLANAVRWLNDPETTRWLEVGDWPLTRDAEDAFFRRAAESRAELNFAVETLEGEHVGFSGLRGIEWQHRVARSGSIIGRRDLWGRGIGGDAALVRTRYAFEVLGLRLLMAEIMAENTPSIRMLTRIGYREAGRIPGRFWKRGALRDAVLMVIEAG